MYSSLREKFTGKRETNKEKKIVSVVTWVHLIGENILSDILILINNSSSFNKGNHDCTVLWISGVN